MSLPPPTSLDLPSIQQLMPPVFGSSAPSTEQLLAVYVDPPVLQPPPRLLHPEGIHALHISDPGEAAIAQPCLSEERCLHGWYDRRKRARAAGLPPDFGGEDLEAAEVPRFGVYQPGGGSYLEDDRVYPVAFGEVFKVSQALFRLRTAFPV